MAEDRVLIPVEQDIIDFDGYPVMGIRLPDGRIGASLRDMCDAMKIDRPSQVQRIRGDETIAGSLVSVQTSTRGGPQMADFLTAWAIPYWLTGVELSRIKDEQKHQAILLFKRRAADVLYQHFSQPTGVHPELSRAVVSVEPTAPAPNANSLAWAEYHRQMVAFYEWKAATDTRIILLEERQDTILEWQESVENRLDEHRRVLAFIPDILDRLGPETLTPAHQKTLQYYVKQLHDATGKPYSTIYEELKTSFAVPRYQDLPEVEWANVVNWFKVQIDRK